MAVRIRKATRSDFRGMRALSENFYSEADSVLDFGDWVFLKRPSRESTRRWFTKLLAEAGRGNAVSLVAEVGGRIVGRCQVMRREPGSELSHVGDVELLVDAGYRNRGAGRKLLDSAIRQSKGKFEMLNLRVLAANKVAKRLYKSMGFRRFGTEPKAVKRGSKYINREYYYLRL